MASLSQHDDKLAVQSSGATSYTNVDGLLLREADVRDAATMTDAQLVKRVKQGFQKIHDELPWIIELRKRFANRPRGKANIAGCKTWIQFCDRVLNRTPRHIQRVLQEFECDVSSRSSDAGPARQVANVKVVQRTKKLTYSTVAYHHLEPSPSRTISVEVAPDPAAKPRTIIVSEVKEPQKNIITPLVLVDAAKPEPSPAARESRRIAKAVTSLKIVLHEFENNLAIVDPEEVRARLIREGDEIQSDLFEVLRSCHSWIGQILAEKAKAAEQRS